MCGFRVGVFEVRVWGMAFSRFAVSGSLFRVCEVPGFRYGVTRLGVRVRCFGVRGFAVRFSVFGLREVRSFRGSGFWVRDFRLGFLMLGVFGVRVRGFRGGVSGSGFHLRRYGFVVWVFRRFVVARFGYGVLLRGFTIRGFGFGFTGSWFRDSGFLQVRGFRFGFRGSGFSMLGVSSRGFPRFRVLVTGLWCSG